MCPRDSLDHHDQRRDIIACQAVVNAGAIAASSDEAAPAQRLKMGRRRGDAESGDVAQLVNRALALSENLHDLKALGMCEPSCR